ncbi:hypothetical protein PTKIN_Ptkin18bG0044900 [Pterospermum kingtungense]
MLESWKDNCGVEVAMYLGWHSWSNRNGCLHKLVCKSTSALALKTRKHCQEFMEANSKPEHVPLRQSTSWSPPMIGFNKLNVDVGFEGLTGRAMYGMVVKDWKGCVLLSASKNVHGIHTPLQAKMMAILFGLQLVHREGLLVHNVESDSLVAISELKKGSSTSSKWLNILLDVDYYGALCGVHSFSYIPRVANELAHQVAKAHSLHETISIWHFSLPQALCT